jgi:hypothetical protein
VAAPDVLYPLFDSSNPEVQNNCERGYLKERCARKDFKQELGACSRRKSTCKVLRKQQFKNKKVNKTVSYAVHHWQV